jgi:hypothetical protein
MSLRCGCKDEGDEIVFGPVHQCSKPEVRVECPGCGQDGTGLESHRLGCFRLPPERPYERMLDEDERRGH